MTGHNELILAEFKYGGVPDETFAWIMGSQDKPSAFFYWLKKCVLPRLASLALPEAHRLVARRDFFPMCYWKTFIKVCPPPSSMFGIAVADARFAGNLVRT